MLQCPECRTDMARTHRTRVQTTVYSSVYLCPRCRLRLGLYHAFLLRQLARVGFVFSRYSCCVRCGSYAVRTMAQRDYVDAMSRDLLGLFQIVLGAPLKKCPECRLQYYDWRPVRSTDKRRVS